MELVNGQCVAVSPPTDVCPNIDGVQPSIPAGMTRENGQCVAATPAPSPPSAPGPGAPVDDCPNIPGVQESVPAGMTKDAQGNCVERSAGPPPPAQPPAPQPPPAQPPQPKGGVAGAEKTITPKQAAKKIRRVGNAGTLPFTGAPLGAVALAGLLLVGLGLALRRVRS
jgi:hypothetical protein